MRVVTCAGGAAWEAPLVRGWQRRELGVELVRRCIDHGELLGVAMTEHPHVVVVAGELPWLDRDLVGTLQDQGVVIVAVESASAVRALDTIGIAHRTADAGAEELAALVHRVGGTRDEPVAGSDDGPRQPGGGRLVAVWGGAGAPGRSTVAVHLAVEAAHRGTNALLIDGDAWSATVAQLLGLAESPSVAQAARAAGDGWRQSLATCLQDGPDGCRVLSGLARAELWPELRERAWTAVLDAAREQHELVVVDLAAAIEEDEELAFDRVPYRRNLMTRVVLGVADEVVLVVAGDPIGIRRGIVAHRTLVESAAAKPDRVVPVLNRAPRTARRLQDCSAQVGEWTGSPPRAFLPVEPQFERVVWEGRPLHAVAPRSPWLRELQSFVGEVVA